MGLFFNLLNFHHWLCSCSAGKGGVRFRVWSCKLHTYKPNCRSKRRVEDQPYYDRASLPQVSPLPFAHCLPIELIWYLLILIIDEESASICWWYKKKQDSMFAALRFTLSNQFFQRWSTKLQFKFWHWMFTYWATTLYPGPLFTSKYDRGTSFMIRNRLTCWKSDVFHPFWHPFCYIFREMGQNWVPDQLLLRFAPLLLQWYSLLKCRLII